MSARSLRSLSLRLAAAGLGAATLVGLALAAPHGAPSAAAATGGRGASVPFTEYEAESAATNGTVIGPSRTAGTLAGEASGRKAVTLSGNGKYVEFTLTAAANAVTLHYSVPDAAGGAAYTTPIAVYVNGSKSQDLTLTNKYSWYYGGYPFTNDPGAGNQHHMYDDVRTRFGSTMPAGTKVKFQLDAASVAVTLDTADFENVGGAIPQPANSLSVTSYGADPTGAADSGSAFVTAIAAASSQGKVLYVPAGTYTVNQHLTVNNVTIQGAGPWYSVLHGNRVGVFGLGEPSSCGQGGNSGVSSNVRLSDFAIFGEVTERNDCDQVNGIGGALGGGSVVNDLWIQHVKVGLWLDGPFDGLTVSNNRILDTTADGLNLHDGISHVTVTNNFLRNLGDDGLAMWSEVNADHDNTFSFNTVELPMLANNIAIYGGHDNSVTDNFVTDTQTQGGGIHVANRFNAVHVSGTTTLARNTTLRAGVLDPNWQFGVGAIWFDAQQGALDGTVNVTDSNLLDSSYEAIQTVEGSSVTNVHFSNITIDGTGTFVLQLQTGGSASFSNVTAAHVGAPSPIYSCLGGGFTISDGGGNSSWYPSTPYCGGWPAPVYTYPGGNNPPPTTTTTTTTTTTAPPSGNLALGKAMTASSYTQVYVPGNANDNNTSSYWESANNAFPQWLQVDLGSVTSVRRIVLTLPPSTAWGARTQTLSVLGSTDGGSFGTVVGSAGYRFDPATGNTVTITVPATSQRYLRLNFTGNDGWPAGQVSEFQVYSS
jgi:hypothetical protein